MPQRINKTLLFLRAAALCTVTGVCIAQVLPPLFPLSQDEAGNWYVYVPVPEHAASAAQQAAELRVREIEAGAALDWGTARADTIIGQLMRAQAASDPASTASQTEKTQAAPSTLDASPLGLTTEQLTGAIQELMDAPNEKDRRAHAIAFRKNPHAFMRDTLMLTGAIQSMAEGKTVDWQALSSQVQSIMDSYGNQVANLFVNALKTSNQPPAPEASAPSEAASAPTEPDEEKSPRQENTGM